MGERVMRSGDPPSAAKMPPYLWSPFSSYLQPDPWFASGYYPIMLSFSTPPVAASGSQAPPNGLSGFDINSYFRTSIT